MKKIIVFSLLFLTLIIAGYSKEECTIGVASGKVTADGRPLLWKNRDISLKYRNNVIRYIKGKKYNFLALMSVGYDKNAWGGTNTAGFCIINSDSKDLSGKNKKGLGNGRFMKLALGVCATIDDFETLLQKTNWPGRITKCNYGIIDSLGNAAIFETRNYSYTKFDANNEKISPRGFIVRANFAYTSTGKGGEIRYRRAKVLFEQSIKENKLDYKYIIRKFARDMSDENGNKYSFPVYNRKNHEHPFSIDTSNTINRTSTASAVIFRGIKKKEPVELTTMWSVLGQPVFSIASPAWVWAGNTSQKLTGKKGSPIFHEALKLYKSQYIFIQKNGKKTGYLSTLQLPVIKKKINLIEEKIFRKTEKFLREIKKKKKISKKNFLKFQNNIGETAYAYLVNIVNEITDNTEIKVGVYGDHGASPVCVNDTMAALKIDKGIIPIVIKGADISAGVLDSLDAVVFPGGSGSKEANSMGESSREKVRDFVLNKGKGCVGICAGGYLLSSTPAYNWSLKLISADVFDREHYNRGRGLIELKLTENGYKFFPELKNINSFYLQYNDGPVLVRSKTSKLSEYNEIGKYITDIHLSGGSKPGITPYKTSLLLNKAGKGQVFVVSGHPESTPGMRWMVPRMVRIVTGRKLIKYSKLIVRPERESKVILFDEKNKKLEKKLFWKLVGDNEDGKINALKKLIELRSRPSLRWAIGLLRDRSKKVRKYAASVLTETGFTPSINDMTTAYKLEKDKETKEFLKKKLDLLKKIIIH